MKILRLVVVSLAVLALLLGGAAVYLLAPTTIPEDSDYAIDRDALERAAHAMPGDLPVRVNHVRVGEASLPRAALFSGFDFSPHRMVHGAYQVVYPDGSFALIDAGFSAAVSAQMDAFGDAQYDARTFEALTQALVDARVVAITHEHADHIQGLAEVGNAAALAPHVFLNRAQAENPETAQLLPGELTGAIPAVDYTGARAIAPGIAVYPAAGHTPGSQLVFVRLANGPGLLFIGDVAWHLDQIRLLAYRPRLVTDLLIGEDRHAVMAQLRTLHGMLDDESLLVVASHDSDQLASLQQRGILGDGLASQ
jgi:glyoxylase-like metal-dependent hydrolase (beta-lactamase superfamily II)